MKGHWMREEAIQTIQALKEELESKRNEVRSASRNLNRAAEIRYGQIPELERQVAEATARLDSSNRCSAC